LGFLNPVLSLKLWKHLRSLFPEVPHFEVKKKTCVIPHHHEIKSGTLKNILNQMDLNEQEFKKL